MHREMKICPLCRLDTAAEDFRESHFIPASLYHKGKKKLQFATRAAKGEVWKEIKDVLLCKRCELRFNENGENEVMRVLVPKVLNSFPLHEKLSLALPRQSHPELERFSGED